MFLLLLPANVQGDQLNALAAAARTLRDPGTQLNVRRAVSNADLYRAMTGVVAT